VPLSISEEQATELAQMFRLMGDPSRLKIIAKCVEAPTCVSEIALCTQLSPSLVSHHLRLLRAARVLSARRVGKQVFYAPCDDHIRSVISDMVAHLSEPSDAQELPGRVIKNSDQPRKQLYGVRRRRA
jgi:ArsR family transcriptional regulator, lead/cadmium/zinc/bismuth-responsive transcriptional repressor